MAVSYNRLWKLLIDKKINQADFRKLADIGEGCLTAAELRDGILINDAKVQYVHNKPPIYYIFPLV